MHRFLVPAEILQASQVVLPAEVSHQVCRVLRMRPGEHVVVLDGNGWEAELVLTCVRRDAAVGEVVERRPAGGEPHVRVTLYQGLLKRDAFEWALQKCTEIGVAEFVPVVSRRTVAQSVFDVGGNKMERWRRIIAEAVEQSRRGRVPILRDALTFEDALARSAQNEGLSLIPWESEQSVGLSAALASWGKERTAVSLFIGPEGGFADEEIALAKCSGAATVTLGPRILRAETAAVVAASLVLHAWGDLG